MEKFIYYAPTKIIFGKDTHLSAATHIRAFGGSRVLVVYGGASAQKSGLLGALCASLQEAGIEYIELGGVVPNPLLSKVREGIECALEFKADFILAVGGGSVIDSAKAIALGAANPDVDVWSYWQGAQKVEKALPSGAVLTISAAGSETSVGSVITNDETAVWAKKALNNDALRCKFAILNPLLTCSLPREQIAAGVVDIFMHTAERYFASILGNHLTDEIAEGLFRTIIRFGRKGVENPQDYEAMSEIMWCGSVSHVGLTGLGNQGDGMVAGDWACHAMSMGFGARFNATHGFALSALWGAWAQHVYNANAARFARMAENVYGVCEGSVEEKALAAIENTVAFFQSLGAPVSLAQLLGKTVDEAVLEEMAQSCTAQGNMKIGGFLKLSSEDVLQIYLAARPSQV